MKAALKSGGFVPGGGSALLHASTIINNLLHTKRDESPDFLNGIRAAHQACYAPFNKIAKNATG